MIAEEPLHPGVVNTPRINVDVEDTVQCIVNSFKQTAAPFNKYLVAFLAGRSLNENQFTQVFIEQLDIQLRKLEYPFGAKNQYQDIYHGSEGFSDFYFHPIEEGLSTASLFSVESKRLPAPTKAREKEYVIGDNNNGGIERYKTEKHGKGLRDCGILGFIEKENFQYWVDRINLWIIEIAKGDKNWNINEVLDVVESNTNDSYYRSIAKRTTEKEITLHHFWVKI